MRPAEYTPRDPSASALYTVVRDHFETFRAESTRLRDGDGLPRFVEDEFRAFLRCGFLAGGFARFRCGDCRTERLVAFSCKGRGFCPSCGGRRMAERAPHLVDHVFPDVPVRQWVLSVPHRIRYVLAWHHDLCRLVARLLHRAVERHLRGLARDQAPALMLSERCLSSLAAAQYFAQQPYPRRIKVVEGKTAPKVRLQGGMHMGVPASEGGGMVPIHADEIVEIPDDNLRAEARDNPHGLDGVRAARR